MSQTTTPKPLKQVLSFTGLTWVLMVAVVSYYCYLYGVVYADKDDFSCYLKWALWSWCVWLVLIPVTFKKVEKKYKNNSESEFIQYVYTLFKLGGFLCLIALATQLVGTWLAGTWSTDNHLYQDVLYYLPTNIKIFIMTVLLAVIYLKKDSVKKSQGHTQENQADRQSSIKCLDNDEEIHVKTGDIDWITAYGNYVQIHSSDNIYLMRATMKEMELKLDNQTFVRIHRSHIVNKRVIKQIKYKNGQKILKTTCQNQLPVGRSYKNSLSNH